MNDWLSTYAEELGADAPGDDSQDVLLRLAAIVAHGTERKNAPLATFMAGRFVERRLADGGTASEAIAEAIAVAEGLIESS